MRTNYVWQIIGAIILTALIAGCGSGGSSAPEGSHGNPINLGTVTNITTLNDSISAYGDRFYKFTTSAAGIYIISITNVTNGLSDLQWELYGDPSYMSGEASDICDNNLPSGDEICSTYSLTSGKTYYLVVSEWATEATSFDLAVQVP